ELQEARGVADDEYREEVERRLLSGPGQRTEEHLRALPGDRLRDRSLLDLPVIKQLCEDRGLRGADADVKAHHDQHSAKQERYAPAPVRARAHIVSRDLDRSERE